MAERNEGIGEFLSEKLLSDGCYGFTTSKVLNILGDRSVTWASYADWRGLGSIQTLSRSAQS